MKKLVVVLIAVVALAIPASANAFTYGQAQAETNNFAYYTCSSARYNNGGSCIWWGNSWCLNTGQNAYAVTQWECSDIVYARLYNGTQKDYYVNIGMDPWGNLIYVYFS